MCRHIQWGVIKSRVTNESCGRSCRYGTLFNNSAEWSQILSAYRTCNVNSLITTSPISLIASSFRSFPLYTGQIELTHVIVAAIHLNGPAGYVILNEEPYCASRYERLWQETHILQEKGCQGTRYVAWSSPRVFQGAGRGHE